MITFLNIFVGVCIFIIGTLFGSFFSLALYRIPRHEDIIVKNSYCPNCKHNLGFFDLIPIISFLIRGGKCKYCREKISIRYLLLEIFNGIIFLLLYSLIGYNLKLLFLIAVYVLLFLIIGVISSNNKLLNKETRKGVFLTELIVAIILFSIVLTSMYIVVRNNINKSIVTIARSNAVNLAVKNTEIAKLTDYNNLESFSNDEIINNINYHIDVKVSKLSDEDSTKQDIVKKIETAVTYSVNGKEYDFSINTVKGKVL